MKGISLSSICLALSFKGLWRISRSSCATWLNKLRNWTLRIHKCLWNDMFFHMWWNPLILRGRRIINHKNRIFFNNSLFNKRCLFCLSTKNAYSLRIQTTISFALFVRVFLMNDGRISIRFTVLLFIMFRININVDNIMILRPTSACVVLTKGNHRLCKI